jgi:hypothetical protein
MSRLIGLLLGALALLSPAASAQDYPARTITLVVPLAPAPAWISSRGFTASSCRSGLASR